MKPKLLPIFLHELFTYDQETGVLNWRVRPRYHFKSDRAWNMANGKYAGKVAGSIQKKGYRTVEISKDGKTYALRVYRIIWAMMTGEWPAEEIDHIDLDKDNNKWGNLREATHVENCHNRSVRSDSKTGIKGVSKRRQKYIAVITSNGVTHYLGQFDTAEEASVSYAKAAEIHHGNFARFE
jgi:HNH endonuclease